MTCYNCNVMNMENKGFTLIELLIVVTILGVVGVLASASFVNSMKDTNQKQCDSFVEEIQNAACAYIRMTDKKITCTRTNCDPIKLEVLINEGFIKSEIDACTGKDINRNQTVIVTWDSDGEKQCEYNGVKTYER